MVARKRVKSISFEIEVPGHGIGVPEPVEGSQKNRHCERSAAIHVSKFPYSVTQSFRIFTNCLAAFLWVTGDGCQSAPIPSDSFCRSKRRVFTGTLGKSIEKSLQASSTEAQSSWPIIPRQQQIFASGLRRCRASINCLKPLT